MSSFTSAFASCFNATAHRVTRTTSRDAYGAECEALAIEADPIPGCLQQLNETEIAARASIGLLSTHRWYCAPSALDCKDLLRIGGVDYEVTRINDVQGRGEIMHVDLALLTDAGVS